MHVAADSCCDTCYWGQLLLHVSLLTVVTCVVPDSCCHMCHWCQLLLHVLLLTGIIGGRFLERGRVKRPDQPRFSTELSQYYQAQDLYVGARLNFNGHKFILVDGDEYAFNYMERHADEVTANILHSLVPSLTHCCPLLSYSCQV